MKDGKPTYQSITLYKDMAPQILELEKVEAGEILQAIMRYVCNGEDTDMSQYDRFVRSLWQTIKLKLDAGEKHAAYISKVRTEAGKKGGLAKASNSKEMLAEDSKCTTYTDTGTGTNSYTNTISSTVTKQESINSASADRQAATAAAEAEPPAGDLFSVKQLLSTAKRNKVRLTDEGVEIFYEEMQETGWILYNRPVEKKEIVKVLRAWAKYHPEYAPVEKIEHEPKRREEDVFLEEKRRIREEDEEEDEEEALINDYEAMKRWLRKHDYDEVGEN